jgi:signal transduction histidine kinase
VFQILVNLLLNAVQAADSSEAEIEVRVARRGGGVAIDVLDNGPGIAESVLPRIFDPFFTTKPTGTGLGLSLSYDLAAQVGGRLEAGNREGGGAIFRLWLPSVPPAADDPEESLPVA